MLVLYPPKNLSFIFLLYTAAAAKSLQSCPTLCDSSPPGSTVPGILQATTLEWVAISFSSVWKWKVKVKSLSRAQLLATPWTAAYQAPLSLGFSRQEYWSGVPLPSPLILLKYYKSLFESTFFVIKRLKNSKHAPPFIRISHSCCCFLNRYLGFLKHPLRRKQEKAQCWDLKIWGIKDMPPISTCWGCATVCWDIHSRTTGKIRFKDGPPFYLFNI